MAFPLRKVKRSGTIGPMTPDRALVEDLARSVLEQAAPEELVIFEDTAEEYFRDPDAVLDPKRRDEAVGFGLDVALLTPYVLAVATPVLTFLLNAAADAAKKEAIPVVGDLVRRLFRRFRRDDYAADDAPDDAPDEAGKARPAGEGPVALTPEQADRVREVAMARAADLGLPEQTQRLLAESVVGGLVVAG